MEPRAGGATDPRGSRGGTGVGVRWARPRRTSPRLSAPSRSLRTGGKQGSLVPGQRWRRRRLQTGAKRPGLGSRPPISTCTRATGLRTSSGGSQESPGRCAGGVCSGSLEMAEHFTVCGRRRAPQRAGPSARQLLSRLDARPLAARAAADVAALVRRAGVTLRLRPKDAINELDSADIEVTDSRLPNPTFMEQRSQHPQSETLGTRTEPSQVTQVKARCASKLPQASGQFYVELVRGSAGFGLTLSGGRDAGADTPLAIRGLLKDGPAQRCGRLQAGDLVLHVNGESTQGLTHAQVVERIRTGGSRLHLVLSRPLDTHSSKPEIGGRPRKGDDCSPDPGGPKVMRSPRASASPLQQPQSCTAPKTQGSPEPNPEGAADSHTVPPLELHPGDTDHQFLSSPGPWLVPSQERLSQALGVPGATHLALEMAAGRQRH